MHRISRKDAARLARKHGFELVALVSHSVMLGSTGEVLTLRCGAKLSVERMCTKFTYWIKYYSADKSDLFAALALLA